MKNYLVIGNPIEHSLSPKLHNYWLKENNIDASYRKKKYDESELPKLINEIRENKISGVNITVPFKKKIISYLDELSMEAERVQSVNTIKFNENKLIGYNTDIEGFELAIKNTKFDISNKRALILGSGGVVPSIIYALKKMKASNIIVSNRTKDRAESLKSLFKDLQIVDWGEIPNFDLVINATSVGLNKDDKINIDFSSIGKNKFFYDLIYNPHETDFLKTGKKLGNIIENGRKMFIYQAAASFNIWHEIKPKINDEVNNLLNND